jgi:hypothetical protein
MDAGARNWPGTVDNTPFYQPLEIAFPGRAIATSGGPIVSQISLPNQTF